VTKQLDYYTYAAILSTKKNFDVEKTPYLHFYKKKNLIRFIKKKLIL